MERSYFKLNPKDKLGTSYRIAGFLGSGWEGEVYKVVECRTGIQRALKIFYTNRKYSNGQLRRYTKKLYNLRHCQIITQYHHSDVINLKGNKYDILVSDLAEGEMLSVYLKNQPSNKMRSFEALHLFYSLVKGVEQIHLRSEYHGDIHSNNVLVKRKGLGYKVRLLDFFDLGRPSKNKMQMDVYDLITLLYDMIGGITYYKKAGNEIHQIIMGRKHNLISNKYKNAGQLRKALEELDWNF